MYLKCNITTNEIAYDDSATSPVSPVVTMTGALGGPLPMLFTAMTYISYSVYGLSERTV